MERASRCKVDPLIETAPRTELVSLEKPVGGNCATTPAIVLRIFCENFHVWKIVDEVS